MIDRIAAMGGSKPQQQGAREAIGDGVITARVKIGLTVDPVTASHDIRVETFKGVVELIGFVETAEVRDEALRVAENVDGVKHVNDSLDIRTRSDGA